MTTGNHRRQGRSLKERLLSWLPQLSNRDSAEAPAPAAEPVELAPPAPAPRVRREQTGSNRRRENPLWVAATWGVPMVAAVLAFSTPFLGIQMHDYLMHSGHFFVRDVVVQGNDRMGDQDLLALAGIRAGTHLLSADLSDMEARLESHPWIARATAQRDLPDKLRITVTEHRPVAYAALDELMLVNVDGSPFAIADPQDDMDIPIVSGLAPDAFDTELSAARSRSDLRAAVNLHRLYHTMGLATRWPIGEIRVLNRRKMSLVLSGTGTEVVLGQGPYREKLYRLEWVLEKLHQENAVAEYLLLDGAIASNPGRDDGRVVVRADLAATPEEIAAEAHRRAQQQVVAPPGTDPNTPEIPGGALPAPPGILPQLSPSGKGTEQQNATRR
ncbi:MAG: FtsQ-type POTRA domain-containing protein [Myxococcota bacterium]|nr:FtsQ-type POTRA domain-containing protein [Myxococcota bacterium]MEE2780311.1 FtsQ-type POTRA domain-containing protein [Myxococcota bacterium]